MVGAVGMLASHPAYPEICYLLMLLGIAKNPVVHPRILYDITEEERQQAIQALTEQIADRINLIPYAQFLYEKG